MSLLTSITGFAGPPAFIFLMLLVTIQPNTYNPYLLKLDKWLPAQAPKPPLLPETRTQAWHLGTIAARLSFGNLTESTAIEMVSALVHRPASQITAKEILSLGEFLHLHEHHQSTWSKLLGFWSFVNLIWVVSIVGMAATITPVIHLLFGNILAELLYQTRRIVMWILHKLRPTYNLLAFYICLSIIDASQRQPVTTQTYVALTGCALSLPALFLSLHQAQFSALRNGRHRISTFIINSFAFLIFTIAAISCSSSLIAFLATTALFAALGFFVAPICCGWCFGFFDESSMILNMFASTILITIMLTLKATGVPSEYLQLFTPGVSIMGGNALGLAGLIMPHTLRCKTKRLIANFVFVQVCIALILVASVYHVTPLRCTATVYLVLWLSRVVCEFVSGEMIVLVIFGGSVAAWKLSFLLKAHPEYLTSLINMF